MTLRRLVLGILSGERGIGRNSSGRLRLGNGIGSEVKARVNLRSDSTSASDKMLGYEFPAQVVKHHNNQHCGIV